MAITCYTIRKKLETAGVTLKQFMKDDLGVSPANFHYWENSGGIPQKWLPRLKEALDHVSRKPPRKRGRITNKDELCRLYSRMMTCIRSEGYTITSFARERLQLPYSTVTNWVQQKYVPYNRALLVEEALRNSSPDRCARIVPNSSIRAKVIRKEGNITEVEFPGLVSHEEDEQELVSFEVPIYMLDQFRIRYSEKRG